MTDQLNSCLLRRGIPVYYTRIISRIVRRFSVNALSQRPEEDRTTREQGMARLPKSCVPFSLKN